MLKRDLILLEHDQQLWGPEDPDPSWHLLGIDAHVVQNVASVSNILGPQQPQDSRNDQSTLVESKRGGKKEALQGIEQALDIRLLLVDGLIQSGIAEPDLGIPLVQILNRGHQMIPCCTYSSLREVVVSDDSCDAGPLPRLIGRAAGEPPLCFLDSCFYAFRIFGVVSNFKFQRLVFPFEPLVLEEIVWATRSSGQFLLSCFLVVKSE
jgi:hypothetical protein